MEIPDRRTALLGLTSAGMSTLLTLSQSSQTSTIDVGEKKELFVVGPYNLGDWFDKSKYEINCAIELFVPKRADIIKSFKECWVYVIDQRIRQAAGPALLALKDYPRIAIAGPYSHEWEDGEKKFVIQIAAVEHLAMSIDNSKATPTRGFRIAEKITSVPLVLGIAIHGDSSGQLCLARKLFF